ncbi:FUSC family protein [Vibrio sp. SS-MA-C1-2]|uniref:FUSC family protein n=1 Tax=Vibrio sp. SS-MA-C1-2 TaxID=2908646 RepID=UPI001F2B2D68|nr:FUSC family protein [Vibrio sp. SS-MA-C1-2]UJF16990.1 FUSC family protein [Vibrio sp. SS-MA-C1-2]
MKIIKYWTDPKSSLFALRLSLTVIVTWLLCLKLDTWATSAAMITVAAIQFTGGHGTNLKKSCARIVGTLSACLYILLISGIGLTDAWLFNFFLILGISLSAGLASLQKNFAAYGAGVIGLTLSIVGFPIAYSPDLTTVFHQVEARACGIILGILATQVISFILPYEDEIHRFKVIKKTTYRFIKNILLGSSISESQKKMAEYLFFICRNKSLPSDTIIGSQASIRDIQLQSSSFLTCISIAINTVILKYMLLESKKDNNHVDWSLFFEKLESGEEVTKLLAPLEISEPIQQQVIESYLVELKKQLTWLNINTLQEEPPQFKQQIEQIKEQEPDLIFCLTNAVRTLLLMCFISFLWTQLEWQGGLYAMMTVGPMCSIYAAMPGVKMANSATLQAQITLAIVGIGISYGIMPFNDPVMFFPFMMLFVYICAYQFHHTAPPIKLFWMFLLIFWSSYVKLDNVPSFDFPSYLDTAYSTIFSVMVAIAGYMAIPETSNVDIAKRFLKKSLKEAKRSHKNNGQFSIENQRILTIYPTLFNSGNRKQLYQFIFIKSAADILNEDQLSVKEQDELERYTRPLIDHNELLFKQQSAKLNGLIQEKLTQYKNENNRSAYEQWWTIALYFPMLTD